MTSEASPRLSAPKALLSSSRQVQETQTRVGKTTFLGREGGEGAALLARLRSMAARLTGLQANATENLQVILK